MSNIRKIQDINVSKFSLLEPNYYGKDKRYIVFELGYQSDARTIEPIMIQLDDTVIYKYTNNELILNITKSSDLTANIEHIDDTIIRCISQNGILKQQNLKGIIYKAMINELTTENQDVFGEAVSVLRLKVNDSTKIFNSKREQITSIEYDKYLLKGNTVKTIIEIMAVIIDTIGKSIYLDCRTRQLCVRKRRPMRIQLEQYSFIDSDNENKDFDENGDLSFNESTIKATSSVVHTERFNDNDTETENVKIVTLTSAGKNIDYDDRNELTENNESEETSDSDISKYVSSSDSDVDSEYQSTSPSLAFFRNLKTNDKVE